MLSDLKQETIDMFNGYVDRGILEKKNVELLTKLINNAENSEEVLAISALGTNYKRTGLHFDKRLEKMGSDIKYLKKNEDLSFVTNPDAITHKLIIGDNYDALLNLLVEYKKAVDVIYIDPPYGKDKMGGFATTNYDNAITRDNLLSMLYPRLILAKQLLTDEGVIFVSIDDRNQAYIKCLMDEIFGESNFIANFCKKTSGGKQDSKTYSVLHEYVIAYSKNIVSFIPARQDKDLDTFSLVDERGKFYRTQLLRKWGDNSKRADRPNLYYPIYFSMDLGKFFMECNDPSCIEIFPVLSNGEEGCWRWEKKTMAKAFLDGRVEIKYNNGAYVPYERLYRDEIEMSKPFSTWLDDVKNDGSLLLNQIFDYKVFKYPKSVDFIMTLLRMVNCRNSIILDFFAGSGTTGQAVLELNRLDGGARQFILVTNNEEFDGKIAYNVTSKRLKRVMTGECYDGTKNFEWLEKNKPYGGNLEVTEIASVSALEKEIGKTAFDVINEKLYGESFDNFQDKVAWVCANFEKAQKLVENDKDWLNRISR